MEHRTGPGCTRRYGVGRLTSVWWPDEVEMARSRAPAELALQREYSLFSEIKAGGRWRRSIICVDGLNGSYL